MTLLNGLLGYFVVLGSVPIIIHLLNRRRFKVVVWAAMEFLLATIEKNSRRLQLRDLILMLLRALAIVFLALALARPTLAPSGLSWLGRSGSSAAVVVLDNSMSMGHHDGRQTRFDAAKKMAREVFEGMPKGASAALVLMSDVAVEAVPEMSHDLVFVGSEASRAQLSDGGTSIMEGLSAAWGILEPAPAAAKEIYLITDLQQRAWPSPEDANWMKLVDAVNGARPKAKLYLLNAGDGKKDNVCIESLEPDDEIVAAGSPVTFNVTLRNYSSTPADGVEVSLYVSETPGEAPRKTAGIVVESVETVHSVRIETRFEKGGEHRVEARSAVDRLTADNSRYIAMNVLDRVKVLVIDGDPAEDDEAFGGETDFLRAAISPYDYDMPDRKDLLEVDVTTVYGLGSRNLRDYGAVILANVSEIPPGLADGLRTFVRSEGHGLVLFLGNHVTAGRYNELLGEKTGLLPGKLTGRLIEADAGDEGGFGMSTEGLQHPIVSFFSAKETKPFFANPRFTSAFEIEVPEVDADAAKKPVDSTTDAIADTLHVIARFTTGQPAIVERRIGRGSVIMFASSADKDWTDFPLRPAFLPVARRAVQHVAMGRMSKKTVGVHERMIEFLSVRDAGAQVTLRDPRGGTRQIPAELSPSGEMAQVSVPSAHFAGFYELVRAGARGGTTYFAANPPRVESDLTAFTVSELKTRYSTLEFDVVSRGEDLRLRLKQERLGLEIWAWFLALCVGCLVAEVLLALKWAPREG